jgi:hypothetical protein
LTVDQKLNFIGVCGCGWGIGLLLFLPTSNGFFTGWIATTTGQIAGWGGIILPLAMILLGITLLFRHYDRLPRVSGMRIGGVVLIYFNLLTWFHFFEGGGFASARLGRGGGFIGAGLNDLLLNTLGRAGEAVVLAAWFLIALIFIIDISLPELAKRSVALVRKTRVNRPAPIPRQTTFDYSQAKSQSSFASTSSEILRV